jgi:RNA polymerase sigma-70 factor (ECF subfamily)
MNGQGDERLVSDFKSGDEQAFDKLYDKYHVPIYSICYRYTRNEDDALDLTQEIFIKVYRNLREFRMQSKFFTWLYRVAVNTCISFKRRERCSGKLSAAESRTLPLGERVRLKIAIDDALAELPGRQRMAFILRYYEGHTFEEIGKMMGITAGAAKANHHHAIRKLRHSLEDWL